MKLHRLRDVTPDGRGTLYRQGRLTGSIMALLFLVVFGGAPVLWYLVGAPWFVWGFCAVLAALVVPLVISDLLAKLRSTNWIVWLRPDGVWINFRSYQNRGSTDTETVVELGFPEIAEVRQAGDVYYTPSSDGGSVRQSLKCLEIHLTHDRTDELAAALAVDRARPAPQRKFGGVEITTRPAHFPVSVPEPGRIRIAWRGGVGNWVTPSLGRLLGQLVGLVVRGESVQRHAADWRDLTAGELDDRILQMAHAGDTISAIDLLKNHRGLSTTQARRFVDELIAPVGSP